MSSPMDEADFVRAMSRRSGVSGHVARSALMMLAFAAVSCDDLGMRELSRFKPAEPEPHVYTKAEGQAIAMQIAARRKAKWRKR